MPEKSSTIDEVVESELTSLNGEFGKNVKLISSIVENLLTSYKNDPESFENGKVCFFCCYCVCFI
jgi:hypothetical protein